MFSSVILGSGSYLPNRVVTNQDFEAHLDTSDTWIRERTGICSRHFAGENEVTSDLGFKAAERALEHAQLTADQIDVIIFATVTPDHPTPSAACALQAKLKCRPIMAFDLSAACSGFLYAFSIADQLIKSGLHRNVLVVGAEVMSRIVDQEDRTTSILFGDGAGAVVLGRAENGKSSCLLGQHLSSDGSSGDLLYIPAGGSRFPAAQATLDERLHFVRMKGREVFKAAIRAMATGCANALEQAGTPISEIDWLIPHQANLRIIESLGAQMGVPNEKVIVNVDKTGNTSSASIPIALDEAIRAGRIQRGQSVLLCSFGAGFTAGSLLIRY